MNCDTCHWQRWNPRCASKKMEVVGAWCVVVTKDFHLKNGKPQTHENGRSEESVFFLVPSLRAISKGSVEESIL